jgi:alginate biosynthesis protein Alg44
VKNAGKTRGAAAVAVSVVREDGQPTRHPWYRIPATVEIDEWRYPVQEWSVEGFSVAGVDGAPEIGARISSRLVFRFDGFSTQVELDAEVIRHDAEDDRLVCRFCDMTRQKAAVLRAVIDSYLLGEFVSMDDIIHVVRRDVAIDREQRQGDPGAGESTRLPTVIRRWAGLALVSALLLVLVSLAGWLTFQRLFVASSVSAVVSAPLVVIRAPQPSFYSSTLPRDIEWVEPRQALAFVKLVGGGAATIDSPCSCLVLSRHVLDGQFVATGEPLITLLPRDARVHVRAKVSAEQARDVALGDRAWVRFPDRTVRGGVVSEVLYAEPPQRAASTPLSAPPTNAPSYTDIVVKMDETLPPSLIGVAVSAQISTYRGPGSSHRPVPDTAS